MTLILAYTPAGTYTNHPTLSEAIADLRQDLFDRTQNLPAGTPQRWADDDLARALDRGEVQLEGERGQALALTRIFAGTPDARCVRVISTCSRRTSRRALSSCLPPHE